MDGILMAWVLGIANHIAEVDALEVASLFTNQSSNRRISSIINECRDAFNRSVISSFSIATGRLTRQRTLLLGWVVAKWIPFCITPFPLIVFFLFNLWALLMLVSPG
nr:hypothetical protein CFP56_31086 [Quercus suber]